jgi:uncharacterized protein (DUF2336 family)
MNIDQSLIAELEDTIRSGSADKRVDSLRRITDLFVADADRFNDQQIAVFDGVIGHLIKRIEGKALAELSQRLGPIESAPTEVVRRLAKDDDLAIARPILEQSRRLSEDDLIEIANTKSQGHLEAIATRSQIGCNVTDALLKHGNQHVFHKLASNSGASFSEGGLETLMKGSEFDEQLTEKLGLRLDIPLKLFRELLLRATEAVRARLLKAAGPESREKIRRVLAEISDDAQKAVGLQHEGEIAAARERMLAMKAKGELSEALLSQQAKANQYADMIAALSLLCGASTELVESLLQSAHREAWLIPCKVAALQWSTVRLVISRSPVVRTMSEEAFDAAQADYLKLSQASAARVLRFWQVRQTASKNAAKQKATEPSIGYSASA